MNFFFFCKYLETLCCVIADAIEWEIFAKNNIRKIIEKAESIITSILLKRAVNIFQVCFLFWKKIFNRTTI